jgi:hypothetical protein
MKDCGMRSMQRGGARATMAQTWVEGAEVVLAMHIGGLSCSELWLVYTHGRSPMGGAPAQKKIDFSLAKWVPNFKMGEGRLWV